MSNQSTLRDQLGIMGIVDQLRHQDQRLTDYMQAHRQREEVKAKITAYYQAQGVTVTPELIEQGIQQWYEKRLRFTPTDIPWYWKAYITRSQWGKFAIAGLVLAACVSGASVALSHFKEQRVQTQFVEQSQSLKAMHANLVASSSLVVPDAMSTDPVLTQSLRETALTLLSEFKADIQAITIPDSDSLIAEHGSIAQASHALEQLQQTIAPVSEKEANLQAAIKSIQSSRLLHKQWLEIKPANNELLSRFPTLSSQYKTTGEEFNSSVPSLGGATQEMRRLSSMLTQASQMEGKLKQLNGLLAALTSSGMSGKELDEFKTMHQQLRSQYEQLTPADEKSFSYLQYAAKVAPLTLTLKVNPQNGPRSAVERTHDTSGGIAYYAITQALDTSGRPVTLMIKDRETSRQAMETTFGIRLSSNKYEALRQDKMQDGVIDQDVLAVKPRGTLKLDTQQGVSAEFITRW